MPHTGYRWQKEDHDYGAQHAELQRELTPVFTSLQGLSRPDACCRWMPKSRPSFRAHMPPYYGWESATVYDGDEPCRFSHMSHGVDCCCNALQAYMDNLKKKEKSKSKATKK